MLPTITPVLVAPTGQAAAYNIPVPVLTETTSPAGSALKFNIGVTSSPDGLYWNMQVASNSGFTTPLTGEGAIRDEVRIVTLSDLTDEDEDSYVESDLFESMANLPGGPTFAHTRLGRESDDGLSIVYGAWSNTVNETVVLESPSSFSPSFKSQYIDLSGGNLTAINQAVNVGLPGAVRCNNSRTGKRYLEFTVAANPDSAAVSYIGVGPTGYTWTADYHANVPGTAGSTAGASFSTYGEVYANGSFTNSGLGNWVAGDVIGMLFDTATSEVSFARNDAWSGPFAVTGMDAWFPFAALDIISSTQRSLAANFGAAAFAHSIPTGGSAFT